MRTYFNPEEIAKTKKKIIYVMGPRSCGKTFGIAKYLVDNKTELPVLFITNYVEDRGLYKYFKELAPTLEIEWAQLSLWEHIDTTKKYHSVVFDDVWWNDGTSIELYNRFKKVVNRLKVTNHIWLTGYKFITSPYLDIADLVVMLDG